MVGKNAFVLNWIQWQKVVALMLVGSKMMQQLQIALDQNGLAYTVLGNYKA